MKKVILLFCLIVNLGFAQTKDEKTVLMNAEYLRKSMVEGNVAVMKSLTASNLSYGHSNGRIENQDEFIDAVVNGGSKFVGIEYKDIKSVLSKNVVTLRHGFEGKLKNQQGEITTLNIQVVQVWQKQKGKWLLLTRQGFRVPAP